MKILAPDPYGVEFILTNAHLGLTTVINNQHKFFRHIFSSLMGTGEISHASTYSITKTCGSP